MTRGTRGPGRRKTRGVPGFLDLLLGTVSIPDLGMTVFLSGRHLVVAPATKAERARFCAAARLLGERPAASVVGALNRLIFR